MAAKNKEVDPNLGPAQQIMASIRPSQLLEGCLREQCETYVGYASGLGEQALSGAVSPDQAKLLVIASVIVNCPYYERYPGCVGPPPQEVPVSIARPEDHAMTLDGTWKLAPV